MSFARYSHSTLNAIFERSKLSMTEQTSPQAGSYRRLIRNMRRQAERDDRFERMRRALIEIEHHSTDKNAQATARAVLALVDGEGVRGTQDG